MKFDCFSKKVEDLDVKARVQISKINRLIGRGIISRDKGGYAKQIVWLDNSFNRARYYAHHGDIYESDRLMRKINIQLRALTAGGLN